MVPLYLSLLHFYLELRERVKREGGYGLEILARFRFYGPKMATQWLKTRLAKIKEQLRKHTLLPQNKFLVEEWFCNTNIRPFRYRQVTS